MNCTGTFISLMATTVPRIQVNAEEEHVSRGRKSASARVRMLSYFSFTGTEHGERKESLRSAARSSPLFLSLHANGEIIS